ncbi:alpha/beta fold hydrolase, partial [Serratia marcescens]
MQHLQNEIPLADLAAEHVYLQVNGRRLHCVMAGEGRPVLLIPGWPQTWYTWRHVMQALAAAGFQAIAVDPPGIGDSDNPAGGYDTGSVGAALHAMMTLLGHERYQLVGHDIGMWIGYAMASDFPQAVERLVLTEAVIPGLAPPPPIFVAPEENIFLWHFMFNQLADLPETLTQGRER